MLELIRANQINTATQLVVNSNTASAANVYLSDVRYQASSSGMADDSQWYTMRVNFGATTLVDRIAIREHNAREFRMYYNGATASIFSLTDANTATLDFLNNTDVNQYFRIPPTYVTSLTLEMRATMTADQNKAIGYLYAGDALTDFDGYVPPAEGYDPVLKDISVVHIMSDGGKRIHSIADAGRLRSGSPICRSRYATNSKRSSTTTAIWFFPLSARPPAGTATFSRACGRGHLAFIAIRITRLRQVIAEPLSLRRPLSNAYYPDL